jgi:hypothetical protein
MNRELKFRVWDEVNNKFFSQEILNALPLDIFLASKHIQQYTGLNDQKDVPIYEGDILIYSLLYNTPLYAVVKWNVDKGRWEITKQCGGNTAEWFKDYTIAGNIFETPKLIYKYE